MLEWDVGSGMLVVGCWLWDVGYGLGYFESYPKPDTNYQLPTTHYHP